MFRCTSTSVDFNHQGRINGTFTIYGEQAQTGGLDFPFQIECGEDNTVKINGFKFPTNDGSANQIMYTNGSNVLAWGYEIKDEDNMSSDSATALATQQSIKNMSMIHHLQDLEFLEMIVQV